MATGTTPQTRRALSAETVDLFLEFRSLLHAHFVAAATDAGLSVSEARALIHLRDPAPMRELAAVLCCDPSNVTGIVDSLERRGFIERQADPKDRRIKQLVFTAAGRRQRDALHQQVYDEAPGFRELSESELRTFRDLLRRALRVEHDR